MAQRSKKDDVLIAAKHVFMECGYYATSMDEIALRAQTTKKTVYNHFETKEILFRAVVQTVGELFIGNLTQLDHQAGNCRNQLTVFLASVVGSLCWRNAMLMQRKLLAVGNEFPELLNHLFKHACGEANSRLARFLSAHDIPENIACLRAEQIMGITVLPYWQRTLYNAEPPFDAPNTDEVLARDSSARFINAGLDVILDAQRLIPAS